MAAVASRKIVFEADRDGELRKGQELLAHTLGHTADTLPHRFFDIISPGFLQPMLESWNSLYCGSTSKGMEIELIRQDGLNALFKISLYPGLENLQGDPGIVGELTPVDNQPHLDHTLEFSEERFGAVFQMSSDPILIVSSTGMLLSVNPAFERKTGLRPEQFHSNNQSWLDVFSEEEHGLLRVAIRNCTERNINYAVECRMRSLQGLRWYDVSLNPLHDAKGRVQGLVLVARDIDQRKKIEFQLTMEAEQLGEKHHQSQQLIGRLKDLLEDMSSLPAGPTDFMDGVTHLLSRRFPDCVISLDTQAGDAEASPDDSTPAVFLQSSMHQALLESRAPLLCNDLQGTPEYKNDALVLTLDAGSFLGAPLIDSSGALQGSLALVSRKREAFAPEDVEIITVVSVLLAGRLLGITMDAQRVTLENHLHHAQKMEAVGKLAGGVAHEFNNILSGILGFSSYLVDKLEEDSDLRKDIEMIQKSAEHASALTRQLLTFARKRHFEKKPIRLNYLIEDASSILRHSVAKGIELRLDLKDALPVVLGSEGQLTQVIMNLCINAAHAIGEEEGRIIIRTEYRPLTPDERLVMGSKDLIPDDACVVLTIDDNGPGMPKDSLKHIFEPFFTTKGEEGTGLGLSIVYGIISNHNGSVTVRSEEGTGTTFTIMLPAEPNKGLEFDDIKDNALEGTEQLLVIDDDDVVRAVVRESMQKYGYTVHCAESGARGIEMLQFDGLRADLVLLDMIMPNMDGVDVYNVLSESLPDLPILVISGYASEDRFAQITGAKSVPFLEKPFKTSLLARRVREVLNEHGRVASGGE